MHATIQMLCVGAGVCLLGLLCWWGLARRAKRRWRGMENQFVDGFATAVQTGSVEALDDLQDYYCGFFERDRLTERDRSRLLQIVRKTSFKLASEPVGSVADRHEWVQLLRDLRAAAKGGLKHGPGPLRRELYPATPLASPHKPEHLDFTDEEMRVSAAPRPARVAT